MSSPSALSDRLGTALAGHYRLERELGAGGMATVYLAEDLKHQRQVAVKVLRPDLAAALGAERFLREIRIAARLTHPHILGLHDSGEAGGFLYYVMPYVEGISLRQKLVREGELPVGEAIRILRDMADAMAYAHSQGVVHRDIKPENVMLTGRHALVMDFGVAKAVAEGQSTTSLTSAGVALGTPAYMAPEQATGDAHTDARADVYAWGVVAYELLAGQPPFIRNTPQATLAAQATATPEPVTVHRENLPAALAALVMQCLEKRAADRPQTAAEIVTRLEAVLTPSGGMTPTGTQPYLTAANRRTQRRRMVRLGVMAAVAIGVTGAGTALWLRLTGAPAPPQVVRQAAVTTEPGLEVEPALSPDGKFLAYTAGPLRRARILVRQVGSGRAVPLTADSQRVQRFPQWTADGEVAFLSAGSVWKAPPMGGQPTAVVARGDGPPIQDFAISHRGDRIAVVRGGRLSIIGPDFGTGDSSLSIRDPGRPAWSPDDRWVAVVGGASEFAGGIQQFGNLSASTVWLVSRDGTSKHPVTDSLSLNASPAWGPDGRSLFFISNLGGGRDLYVQMLDRSGRAAGPAQRLTTGAFPHGVTVSGDGTTLIYSAFTPRTAVWRVRIPPKGEATLDDAEQLTFENAVIETMNVTRDGRWLYYDAARDGSSDLYRVQIGSREPERLTDHPANDFLPELSPDGRLIVFQSQRHGTRDLFLMDSAGGPARALVEGPGVQNYPHWSPDGRKVVFWGDRGSCWVIERTESNGWGEAVRVFDAGGGPPSWNADGTAILTGTGAMILRVDLATRRVDTLYRRNADAGQPTVSYPILSRDGRTIYFRNGAGTFMAIPARGGAPRTVLRIEGNREANRAEYATDGIYLYFTLDDRQGDLWRLELK